MIQTLKHTLFARLVLCAALSMAAIAAQPTAMAQTAGGDVEVNLDALGLASGAAPPPQPRLYLKYPGASTATRQVPQLRYPQVPIPVIRPATPEAPAAAAAKPQPPKSEPDTATAAKTAPPADPTGLPLDKPHAFAQSPAMEAQPTNGPATPEVPVEPAAEPAPEPKAEPAPKEAAVAPKTEPRSVTAASATPPAAAAAPAPESPVSEPQVASLGTPPAAQQLTAPDPAILRVIFDSDAAAIVGTARSQLDSIAESLRYDPRRIELKAFGGTPGDKTSNARRLSLKRGLAVRAYLMELGIDSRRIDVRALGGTTDTGAPDRVDVTYSNG